VTRRPWGATLYTAGIWDVTATNPTDGITGSATVQVTPAAATGLVVTGPDIVTAGMPFDLTVTAVDPYGNIDTNYQGTVTFSTTDPDPSVMLPADYPFTVDDAGVHTFPGAATLYTVGTWDITAMDLANGLTGTATITVSTNPPRPHRNTFPSGYLASLLGNMDAVGAGVSAVPAPGTGLGLGALPAGHLTAASLPRAVPEIAFGQLARTDAMFRPFPILTARHARDAVFEAWGDPLGELLAADWSGKSILGARRDVTATGAEEVPVPL
jgi:hypothetical protein